MTRYALFLFLLLLLLMTLACQLPSSGPQQLTIKGTDTFHYDPAEMSLTTGREVSLTFVNEGSLQHNWTLVPAGVDLLNVDPAQIVDGIATENVDRGSSETLTFTVPAPGAYQFVCTIPGHANAGMIGALTVAAAP